MGTEMAVAFSNIFMNKVDTEILGVSWCCGHYCLLAFVLWCGYCSVSFQSFVLRHWCPQHQETTEILSQSELKPRVWKRFIDDIFSLWTINRDRIK